MSKATNIVIDRNVITHNADVRSNGSDYGVVFYFPNYVTVSNNEIAYTGSEGIHIQAPAGVAAVYSIVGNWIHHTGDGTFAGPAVVGTPSGMIINADNATGSVVENNLIQNLRSNDPARTGPRGIILENTADNWILRNNVFEDIPAECIKLDANSSSTDNNQIYNNLFVRCGQGSVGAGAGAGIVFVTTDGTRTANNNKIYNNTFINSFGGGIASVCSGPCTGNIFRNNLMYDSGSKQLVTWDEPGVFQNNLVFSSASGTLVRFNGGSYNCSQLTPSADIDGDGASGDGILCSTPQFVQASASDFHLTSLSPAINKGTSTGMPSGKTASINNTISNLHGLPSYADNLPMSGTAWDIGAVEYGSVAGPPTASISLSDPSPTTAGNIVLTLTTSKPVVQIPGAVVFLESDSTTTLTVLSGSLPGSVFTGTFVVNSSVADGLGTFSLPQGSLVDGSGNTGNAITSGSQTTIDKTPPSTPANLRYGI